MGGDGHIALMGASDAMPKYVLFGSRGEILGKAGMRGPRLQCGSAAAVRYIDSVKQDGRSPTTILAGRRV
jgi:hypothetical protein